MAIAEADLKVGDRVVYPNQGVCRVVGVTDMEIGGQRETFIKLSREDDQATVMVPKGRVEKVGLRRVADTSEINTIFTYLASPVEGPELDWKVRHRTHGERMSEGGLMGLAQVVKGLTTLSDLRPLPPKERELYDNARHLLVSEIAAAMSFSEVMAEDAVDIALFPPGVERKKPVLALPLGEEGEELGLGADLELGEEVLEPEAAVEPEGGEEAGEAEVEEAEAGEEVEVEEEAEEAPKKKARAPRKPAAPKAAKPKKAAVKAAKPKAEKPAAKKAATKAAPKKAKAAKPAAARKTAAKKTKSKK